MFVVFFINIDRNVMVRSGSVFEVWLMSRYRMFDKQRRCYSSSDGISRDLDTSIGVDLSDALLRVADRVQALGLTDDQVALTIALVVYVTGKTAFIATSIGFRPTV